MIGIVMCCHGNMGEGMKHAAEMIVPIGEQLAVVSVQPGDSGERILAALKKAIAATDTGDGSLILTDMFGGTPTNISCALLKNANVEIVTGFSLPVLIKALELRAETTDLSSMAKTASEYGKRYILIAGELLKKGESGK